MNGNFGQEVSKGPFDMTVREAKRHRLVTSVEELHPFFSRNIYSALNISFVDVGYRDFFPRPLSRQLGIIKIEKVVDCFSHAGILPNRIATSVNPLWRREIEGSRYLKALPPSTTALECRIAS